MTKTEAGTTKSGKTFHKFELTDAEYHHLDENYTGLCVFCGDEIDQCEPDARLRECEGCGGRGGYGANELLMRGLITFKGDDA